jgi:hypothetical protein
VVRNASSIDKETFRDLCAGIDPRTGKDLVRGSGERHRAEWDITFSTPKTFGILWAAGTAERRAVLEKIQQEVQRFGQPIELDEQGHRKRHAGLRPLRRQAIASTSRKHFDTGRPPSRSVWFGRLIDIARLRAQFSDHCRKGG